MLMSTSTMNIHPLHSKISLIRIHVHRTQSPAGSNHIIHLHNPQEKVKEGRVKVNAILIWNNSGSGREEEKGKGGQKESKFKRRSELKR